MYYQKVGASEQAIQHHYDVGNDFYQLWLDPSLSYSCALWEQGENYDALEKAQKRKVLYHLKQSEAYGQERVLDVGCGWGGIIKAAAEDCDCKYALGLTLSKQQAEYITSFKNPKIEVRLENWLNHEPNQPYDAITSVGSFEHFAKPNLPVEEKIAGYREFFSRCHRWLKKGGKLSLQTIAYGNPHEEHLNAFISNEVFPDSDYPWLAEVASASERLFEITNLRNDRMDYAMTCRAWLKRLKAKRSEAVQLVGEEMVQRYEKYLQISVFSFESGTMDLYRIGFRRIDNPAI